MEILHMSKDKEENKKEEKIELNLTKEEEEALKKKLEELRKRDPFVYR